MRNEELPIHPEYKSLAKEWKIYKDLYEGVKQTLINNYLIQHEFETTEGGEKLWLTRKARTEYNNLCKPFINRFISMIFTGTQDYKDAKEIFADEFDNISGDNDDLESFIKHDIAKDYLLFGRVVIHINSFNVKGARPFAKILDPLSLKDWRHSTQPEDFGQLIMCRFEYSIIESDSPFKNSESVEYSDIWYKENENVVQVIFKRKDGQWMKYDEKVIEGLDVLPFVIFDSKTRMSDGAPLLRSRYNLESGLDNQVLYQSLQKIVIVGNVEKGAGAVFSEGAITVIPGDGNLTVVEPSDPIALERRVESKTNDFFKVMFNQTRHMPIDAKGVEGANTINAQKQDFLKEVESCAKDLSLITNNMLVIMAKFKGIDFVIQDSGITIGQDLSIESLDAQINLARLFLDNMGEKWRKATYRKIARSQNLPEIDEVIDEIDNSTVNKTLTVPEPAQRLKTLLNG